MLELATRWLVVGRTPFEARFPVDAVRGPVPYSMFGGVPNAALGAGYDVAERLNSQGYRGREATEPKPPDELRVVVLGGSTVFEGEPTLPELLERELRKRGVANVACFNFGGVSSVSGMEVSRLLFEVTDLRPDVVVFYDGGNDLLLPAVYDPRPGYPFNFVVYESNPLLHRNPASFPGVLREREGVAVYDLSGVYDGIKTDIFVDLVHTGPRGREIIARSMAQELVARTSLQARAALGPRLAPTKAASGG